ncbi:MAG: murein biosynthesis integral membrane protein MurJ [Candidatus Manganitrophus sp. SA1]|nr:murein biosynthesis integral membrane protein MurJ [Candidatus Manganitrophus morganii]
MESQGKSLAAQGHVEKGIAGAAGIVAFGTLISRILGFIRDMILANLFGATIAADAFYVAFRIPNILRELFAEGSMSAAFIPVFTEYVSKKSRSEAKELASAAFTTLLLLLCIVVAFGIFFSPQLIRLIAPGFVDDPHKFSLTVSMTRIMFPFLLFISLAALAMGILNSTRRFAPPALASGVFNVVSILFVFGFTPLLPEPVYGAAVGVALGGLAQFLIQVPALYQEGFPLSFRRPIRPLHPGVVQMGRLLLPTTLGLSVTQINVLVNTLLASYLVAGSVTYLYFGMRLIHFPLGIFAVALSTAILPTLSTQAAKGETEGLRQTFSFGLRLVFFITFPAMMGLILFRIPIVHLLFEHGEFGRVATLGTANAVLFYSIGLWAFAGIRIVVPVFYSLQDTKTPVKIGLVAVVANVILNLILMGPLQHSGLALATSLSAILNFSLLLLILRKRIGRIDGKRILNSHLKVLLASSTLLPISLWLNAQEMWLSSGNLLFKAALLAIAIAVSAASYFLIQASLKSEEVYFILNLIKSRLTKRSQTPH